MRTSISVLMFLVHLAYSGSVCAHDLDIDHLSLWTEPGALVLRGQLSVDPDLTRRNGTASTAAEVPAEVAAEVAAGVAAEVATEVATKATVERFVRRVLHISVNGSPSACEVEIRELWQRGGAVPGDIVMLRCPVAEPLRSLAVSVTAEVPSLAVTVTPGGDSAPLSVLIRGGEASPVLDVTDHAVPAPGSDVSPGRWQSGGAELFVEGSPARGEQAAGTAAFGNGAAGTGADANGALGTGADAAQGRDGAATAKSTAATGATGNARGGGLTDLAVGYARLGFEHILPRGWDHVLFVVGLVLVSGRFTKALLLDVTTFTAAHSVTLALGAVGWIVLPARLVEPLIALSIAVMGAENLLGRGSWERRWLIFGFGLLHGQGFASALLAVNPVSGAFLTALLGFNLGVEAGQLLVAVAVVAVLALLRRVQPDTAWQRRYVVVPASAALVVVGLFWTIQRVLA